MYLVIGHTVENQGVPLLKIINFLLPLSIFSYTSKAFFDVGKSFNMLIAIR